MLVGPKFSRILRDVMLLKRYTDTPDGDWIIDNYESDPSLVIATAGSGHAYKVCHDIHSMKPRGLIGKSIY